MMSEALISLNLSSDVKFIRMISEELSSLNCAENVKFFEFDASNIEFKEFNKFNIGGSIPLNSTIRRHFLTNLT